MMTAIVPANAYVVGPTTMATTRVQAISKASAARPDKPPTVAGSHRGTANGAGATRFGRGFGSRRPELDGAWVDGSSRLVFRTMRRIVIAATALARTPVNVVPVTPI